MLARFWCRLRGCKPDWAYTIACRLEQPVCIRCHRTMRTHAPDEELGVLCVEDPERAW